METAAHNVMASPSKLLGAVLVAGALGGGSASFVPPLFVNGDDSPGLTQAETARLLAIETRLDGINAGMESVHLRLDGTERRLRGDSARIENVACEIQALREGTNYLLCYAPRR